MPVCSGNYKKVDKVDLSFLLLCEIIYLCIQIISYSFLKIDIQNVEISKACWLKYLKRSLF